jgi:hypothetical protein
VGVIVYVETNFLMSVAMGREAQGDELLASVSASVRIAIPSGCFMEAFSAFEDEQKRRNWFKGELEKQIGQLRRDTTSAHATSLQTRLEECRLINERLLIDVKDRLFQFVNRASGVVELIPVTAAVLRTAVGTTLIRDPTDNLILSTILDHAARFPADTKALLTDNTRDFATSEVETALTAAGISKSFRTVANVLGWLGSLAP